MDQSESGSKRLCKKTCKKGSKTIIPAGGIWMRKCRPRYRHPCDPDPPCNVCEADACPEPAICVEKIKNPQPAHETRCLPGRPAYLPTAGCVIDPVHPCDPPPPCKPGKPKPRPCKPGLCKERIKNLEEPLVRCPDPDDIYSHEICENMDFLKKPIPECSRDPCAPPVLRDPFAEPKPKPYKPEKCVDPNEWRYSRLLCENWDLLKQGIKNAFTPHSCEPPRLIDPFAQPKPNYPKKNDPCDRDPNEDIRREKKAVYMRPCNKGRDESIKKSDPPC